MKLTDYGIALEKVELFRELLVTHSWLRQRARQGQGLHYEFPDGGHISWNEVQIRILRLQPLIEAIAREVEPDGDANRFKQTHYASRWNWAGALKATERLIGILEGQDERQAILGSSGPVLAAEGLHPWIWDAAVDLWDDGHYKEAVSKASAAVEYQTQMKLDRADLSGSDLFTQAFRTDAPRSNEPRLRFTHLEEETGGGQRSQTWNSAHEGAMQFGRGCWQGIRNLTAHGPTEPTEQKALEFLAALSVLARWVDTAEVVAASTGAED